MSLRELPPTDLMAPNAAERALFVVKSAAITMFSLSGPETNLMAAIVLIAGRMMSPINIFYRKQAWISLSILLFVLSIAIAGFSQTPPPNDNFTNATVLTGSDLTFSGTLAGATLEPGDQTAAFGTDLSYISNSVWWSWTSPVSTVLNLEIFPPAVFPQPAPDYVGWQDFLFIYAATNGTVSPSGLNLPSVASVFLVYSMPNFTLSVPVSAGTNYRFQMIGNSSVSYSFHLIATNTPLIYTQPANRTVVSNASAMFYVESGGLLPKTYQWFLNGTNLTGETAPIFALNHIDSSMAGNYTVLVSNAMGSITSAPATLTVLPAYAPPQFRAVTRQGNLLSLSITNYPGQVYRIDRSDDLINWTPENSFELLAAFADPHGAFFGNVVYSPNASLPLTLTNTSPQQYYRVSVYQAPNADADTCINNLKQIEVAKKLWRTETKAAATSEPIYSVLVPYFPHPTNLVCPNDTANGFFTSYAIQRGFWAPICQIHSTTHVLEVVP